MGVTPRPMGQETIERRNVTAPSGPGPAPGPAPVQSLSSYMAEDDLFRNPYVDGFPSRR